MDAEVYMLEAWKIASSRKRPSSHSFLAMDAFSTYIRKVDDLLDQLGHPDFSTNRVYYRKDPLAQKTISSFVRMVRESALSPEEKRVVFNDAIAYRKHATRVMERFEHISNPSFDEVLKMREQTTGEMGRVLAQILNVMERVPPGKSANVESMFFNYFMGLQVMDDMADVQEDHENHTINLAAPILKKHPEEWVRILNSKKSGVSVFRKNCPKSYRELLELSQRYLRALPRDKQSEKAFLALFRLTFRIIDWLPSKTRR